MGLVIVGPFEYEYEYEYRLAPEYEYDSRPKPRNQYRIITPLGFSPKPGSPPNLPKSHPPATRGAKTFNPSAVSSKRPPGGGAIPNETVSPGYRNW